MTDREKVYEAKKLIQDLGIEDVKSNAEETYQLFRNVSLFEIAELITDMSNTIYDLKDILENEE